MQDGHQEHAFGPQEETDFAPCEGRTRGVDFQCPLVSNDYPDNRQGKHHRYCRLVWQ